MPKMKPDTMRVAISMPKDADLSEALEVAKIAALNHNSEVEPDSMTVRTWFKAGPEKGGLSMGVPAAKTRWTKDGNLSVEVC